MMEALSKDIWVAIPAMDENQFLPECLDSLARQSIKGFNVVVCVNQPDRWWNDPEKIDVCLNNSETLTWLRKNQRSFSFKLTIIDRSSKGNGWPDGRGGAGIARRTALDEAAKAGGLNACLVSADADTLFDSTYLADISQKFATNPGVSAISSPYYHNMTGDLLLDIAMLNYEIFMRLYLLNLIRIKSPYAFTALGSAMAFSASGYQKSGGVPDKNSGEDFYLLQKVAKHSKILLWLPSKVYPAVRLSNRVGFGTGTALANGISGNSFRYAVIHPKNFDAVKDLYEAFPRLFYEDIETNSDHLIESIFGEHQIWKPLRNNSKTLTTFINACHQKFDGLRIWQLVRKMANNDDRIQSLQANLKLFLPDYGKRYIFTPDLFSDKPLLQQIRDELFAVEINERKKYDKGQ